MKKQVQRLKQKNKQKQRKNDLLAFIFILFIGLISGVCTYLIATTLTNPTSEAEASKCYITLVNGSGNHGIKVQDNKAKITVTLTGPKGCTVPVTLALWDAKNPSGLPLAAQTLSDSKTKVYGPGTYTMGIPIPACMYYQVDVLYQTNPKSVVNGNANYQIPQDALANFKLGKTNCPTPPPPPPTPTPPPPPPTPTPPPPPPTPTPPPPPPPPTPTPPPPPNPTDVCPNIAGMQTEVPDDMVIDEDGNCVAPEDGDVCPNIDGMQTEVPDGMVKDDEGNCVEPEDIDVCPNIEGMQKTLPKGYTRAEDGRCLIKTSRVVGGKAAPESIPDTGPGEITAIVVGVVTISSSLLYLLYIRRKAV